MTQSSTLVSVALRAAADPGVEFEVTHIDGMGEPQIDLDDAAAENPWLLGESFTSYGIGTRLEVRTRRVGPAQDMPLAVSRAISQGTTVIDAADIVSEDLVRRTTWTGGTPGDPDFFFNFEDKLDLLLTFHENVDLSASIDSMALSKALLTASRAAGVDVELPVTFVRSPAAGFYASQLRAPTAEDGDPLLARGLSLRMTVGLDQSDPRARLALLAMLTDFAATEGYELRVADRRFGSVSGQWILVNALGKRPEPANTPADPADEVATAASAHSSAALLTVVGPSRQGSFAAVAAALDAAGLRPRAVTCLSLHDVAFCHFEIDLSRAHAALAATWARLSPTISLVGLVDAIRAAHSEPVDPSHLHAARDHQCLLSAPFVPLRGAGLWHPVWASWEVRDVPGAVGDTRTVQQLRRLFVEDQADLIADCLPEYYRFRRRSSEVVIERVKLRVRLQEASRSTDVVQARLADVCRNVQRAIRLPGGWSLPPTPGVTVGGPVPRLVKLRVAHRERWLGTWLDDPR